MPLDDLIIEEIKKREDAERRKRERPQPQVEIPKPPPRPRKPDKDSDNPDDGNKRGVEIIEPGEDIGNVDYEVRK